MLCSISGQVPIHPVVSIKSGYIFEKRLILQYLSQNQFHCPITNEELTETDLLDVQSSSLLNTNHKTNTTVFTPEASSIPQLLSLFQNEWDATILETFTLKKHLEKTRMELSHALYQHDAACRVIARLNKENTSLRTKLTSMTNGDVEMETSDGLLSTDILLKIEEKQKVLAKERKDFKKTISPSRAMELTNLTEWKQSSSHTIHDVEKPGILCIAIDSRSIQIATGGNDKHIKVFHSQTEQVITTLKGHEKKINTVIFHPTADMIISGSQDKTIKLWNQTNVVMTFSNHQDAITNVSIHPTGDYLLSSSLDGTWALSDIRAGALLAHYNTQGNQVNATTNTETSHLNCASFHPDGGIFATGSSTNAVQMWDIKSMTNVVTFDGHHSAVNALTFSENGYQLATGSEQGIVHIWDLRKLKSIYEINLSKQLHGPIHCINMDGSGQYLAIGGGTNSYGTICVLKEVGKTEWQVVKTWDQEHKSSVTGVAFAPNNKFLASTSLDRSLKLFR